MALCPIKSFVYFVRKDVVDVVDDDDNGGDSLNDITYRCQ
jgi:hypothetical protein